MKHLLASIALVLVLLFTGCSAGTDEPVDPPTVEVTVTESATPTPSETPSSVAPSESSDEDFLAFVRAEIPYFDSFADKDLISFADAVCTDLDNGYTVQDEAKTLAKGVDSDAEAQAYGGLLGASVAAYCPEYSDQFSNGTTA